MSRSAGKPAPEDTPEIEEVPYDPEGFEVIMRNGSQPNYMRDDHTSRIWGNAFWIRAM